MWFIGLAGYLTISFALSDAHIGPNDPHYWLIFLSLVVVDINTYHSTRNRFERKDK